MNINEMLTEHSLLVDFNASSKKHVLDSLSKLAEKKLVLTTELYWII